jgi:hypothetical protein
MLKEIVAERPASSRSQQIRTIKQAYSELHDLNLQDGFRDVVILLHMMNLAAERQHRKCAPYGQRHGLTMSDAAKLFTVSHLLDGWSEPNKFTVDDITSIRSEVLYAQAYAKRFHVELADWATKYALLFTRIDYAKLMDVSQRSEVL